MKVRKLIQELKKLPLNAIVVWQDHDQLKAEFNGKCNSVVLLDTEECDKDDNPFDESGIFAVLHN